MTALRPLRYGSVTLSEKKFGQYVFLRKGCVSCSSLMILNKPVSFLYHSNSDCLTEVTVNPFEVIIAKFSHFTTPIWLLVNWIQQNMPFAEYAIPCLTRAGRWNSLHFETIDFEKSEKKPLVVYICIYLEVITLSL